MPQFQWQQQDFEIESLSMGIARRGKITIAVVKVHRLSPRATPTATVPVLPTHKAYTVDAVRETMMAPFPILL